MRDVFVLLKARQAVGLAHADNLVHGQRSRAHAAFVSAAVHLALNAHTRLAANVECANAFGAVDLVCRKTHQIDLQMVNIEIDLAGSLRSVAVKDNAALAAELAAGRSVGLATLLATRGSMPRHEGARMAVLASGAQVGTVGGGAIERLATERADAARRGGVADLEWVTSGASMACGGDALLAVRALTARDLPVLLALQDALERDEPVTVEERWADASAPELLLAPAERAPGPTWDAADATYREPVCAPSRLHIFGAGHVGAALVGLAAQVGFEVRVYDDRPELARGASLPVAASVACGPFDELAAAAQIGPRDSVVVLTHGHAHDEAVLLAVLMRDVQPAYVGCIGSRRKAALTREHLAAAGVPRERADAVHLPIGEAIGAVTPSEIAVSIVAQLVRCRAERREGKDRDAKRGKETT